MCFISVLHEQRSLLLLFVQRHSKCQNFVLAAGLCVTKRIKIASCCRFPIIPFERLAHFAQQFKMIIKYPLNELLWLPFYHALTITLSNFSRCFWFIMRVQRRNAACLLHTYKLHIYSDELLSLSNVTNMMSSKSLAKCVNHSKNVHIV